MNESKPFFTIRRILHPLTVNSSRSILSLCRCGVDSSAIMRVPLSQSILKEQEWKEMVCQNLQLLGNIIITPLNYMTHQSARIDSFFTWTPYNYITHYLIWLVVVVWWTIYFTFVCIVFCVWFCIIVYWQFVKCAWEKGLEYTCYLVY